jgi:CHRD domain
MMPGAHSVWILRFHKDHSPFEHHMETAMKNLRKTFSFTGVVALAAVWLPTLPAQAAPESLGAVASASQEGAAPAASDLGAVGVVDFKIDGVSGDVCVSSTISGLSGAIANAHIHTGGAGVTGPVFVGLPFTSSSVVGCVTATPAQAQAILASPNNFYFNVHTAASPGGALRGQLTKSLFSTALSGLNEVPPGDPDGSGTAIVAVDSTASNACVLTNVAAIELPAAAAHIHTGAVGVNGPVVVPLAAPAATASASCGTASAAVISLIVSAPTNHYVNIHTPLFPNGAIRGNLATRTAAAVPIAPTTTIATTSSTQPPVVIVSVPPSTTAAVATTATTAPVATTTTTSTAPATTTILAPTTTTSAEAAEASPADPQTQEPEFVG